MSDLPVGTVTMLFTDIEGSTSLVSRVGDAYRDVLSTHRAIMRAAIGEHGGREMGTEGDSFFVVFRTAVDGVRCALRAQERLSATPWPDGADLRVRMGLHTGEPVRHEDGYVGLDVHRAARVASAAHGGQVLVSGATWALAGAALTDLHVLDLGSHRLKDIPQAERLLQVSAPGEVAASFPPVRSLGSVSSLPRPAASLVARDEDLAAVDRALRAPGCRLVTLAGPGGVGKTQLALAVAHAWSEAAHGEVFFVPLESVTTAAELWRAVAEGVGGAGRGGSADEVCALLGQRDVLLVLDNLEQVQDAGPVLRELVQGCPGARILATSRLPVRLSAEQVWPVRPLDAAAATEMFVDRVRRHRPDYRLEEGQHPVVDELLERLDRLPLAIELVAARAAVLGPADLLRHLESGLRLSTRAADVPARQRSLADALDWSLRLLGEEQLRLLRSLAVMEGPFDVAAAARVADVPEVAALDVLLDLVDAHLVVPVDSSQPELRLPNTVARHLRDGMTQPPPDVAGRHAAWVADLVTEVAAGLRTARHLRARDRLVAQEGNIGRALAWTAQGAPDEVRTGLRICAALGWYWSACGRPAEGRRWLTRFAEVSRALPVEPDIGLLRRLGVLLLHAGHVDEAVRAFTRCIEHHRSHGDRVGEALSLNSLGLAHRARGDRARAREVLGRAVDLARADADDSRLSNALSNAALVEIDDGHAELAVEMLGEVLRIDLEAGDVWGIAADRVNLAAAHLAADRMGEATALVLAHGAEALALDDAELTAELLEHTAVLCARHGVDLVPELVGAARATRLAAGTPLTEQDARLLQERLLPVRDRAGVPAWEAGLRRGERTPPPEVFAEAATLLRAAARQDHQLVEEDRR